MNEYTNEELIRMARWQRRLLYTFMYSWICGLLFLVIVLCCSDISVSAWYAVFMEIIRYVVMLGFMIAFWVTYYKLLLTYHSLVFKIFAGILGVLMIVPLVNLIALLIVSSPATFPLKKAGLRVGLLGVSECELRKLQN